MKAWMNKKKKGITAAILGLSAILGMALLIAFNSKIDVDSNATYIQEVKEALIAAESNNGLVLNVPYEASKLSGESKAYSINTPADWLALSVLSYEHSLEGYDFFVQKYTVGSEDKYDLNSIVIGDKTFAFKGISLNEEYPFKGNIASTLGGNSAGDGGIRLELSSPLFGYLDATGKVNVSADKEVYFSVKLDQASSGLAQVLTGIGTINNTTIKNVVFISQGTIENTAGYAGGLFGEIRGPESGELVIDSIGVTSHVSSVSGVCTGGIAGKVSGNVRMTVDKSLWNDTMTVSYTPETNITEGTQINHSVGVLFGEVAGESDTVKPVITIPDGLSISNTIGTGAAYTGGLIGKAQWCELNIAGALTVQNATQETASDGTVTTTSAPMNISAGSTITTDTYSGGMIGCMENVTITGATDTSKSIYLDTQGNASYIGGIAGYMKDCTATLPVVTFKSQYTEGTYIGGLIGESNNINMTMSEVSLIDAFTISGNASAAGGVVGADTTSTYTITNALSIDKAITVSSSAQACCVGGFAGSLTDTDITNVKGITTTGTTVTATSTTATGDKAIFVGGIIGKYVNNTTNDITLTDFHVDEMNIHSLSTTNYSYIGGIIGAIDSANVDGTGKINLSDCSAKNFTAYPHGTANSSVETKLKTYLGGILGANFISGSEFSNVTSQANNKYRDVYCYGGVVALAAADCRVENAVDMINTTYTGSHAIRAKINGGIVGEIADSITVEVENDSEEKVMFASGRLSHRYDYGTVAGGIAGKTGVGSVLCLNGYIDLSNVKPAGSRDSSKYYGSVVGEQNNSLIYINPIGYGDAGYTYGFKIAEIGFADEVGNYGSVYRNGNWDSVSPDTALNDKAQWVILYDGETTTINQDSDPYTLSTVGDCMRLSIALNSENQFKAYTTDVTCTDLLSKEYVLTSKIDLSNTGIQTLNKNHVNTSSKKIDDQYVFTGKITGSSKETCSITNTFNVTNQGYLGLFSAIGDGATFSDIGINMSISYYSDLDGNPYNIHDSDTVCDSYVLRKTQHFGGIAAYATGNISISNVNLKVFHEEDKNLWLESINTFNRFFGGAIGQYVVQKSGNALTMTGINADINMKISEKNHYAGGLVGYVDNSTAGGTINITDASVSGTLKSIYTASDLDTARIAGMIAAIGSETVTDANAVAEKMDVVLTNISINGLQIQDELNWTSYVMYDCGGLIGYQWKNVDVTAEGIFVNKSGDIYPGINIAYHSSGATYGGLWSKVCGHMSLKDVAINAMNISVPGSATNLNGLLVGNGQYLYLELENYKIGSSTGSADSITSADITDDGQNVTISDTSALYFDEIVGYTKGSTAYTKDNIGAVDLANLAGGVVSIKEATEYKLYNNKIVTQSNPYTRYYYNITEDLTGIDQLSSNTVTISSAAKMLQWSLAHHMNTPLRKLTQYFNIAESYGTSSENITFSGIIDLGDISYYPVSIGGCSYYGASGSKIIFNGKIFDQYVTDWRSANAGKEEQLKYTYKYVSEHYLLQSGLFYNVTQCTIDGITLGGSVTAVESTAANGQMFSGALISGAIQGVELETEAGSEYINYDPKATTITRIVLDNVSVSHVNASDNWHGNYGLMVARIGSGAKVHIGPEDTTSDVAGVTMKNYNSETGKVAAALIGMVGHEDAQGINISFLNMQVADVADAVSDATVVGRDSIEASSENMDINGAKVLAHASFIYSYEYKLDNTNGVYIFYLDDYQNQNVTLGEEIGSTVQFYDADLTKSILDYTFDSSNGCLEFNPDNYKPYVYQVKEIDVNPKNGNIIKGCGTYADPYVIETSNQLMTLYYYLTDHDTYKNTLKDWEINAFGVDVVENGSANVEEHTTHDTKHYNIGLMLDADDETLAEGEEASTYETLVADGFPSIEQLSNAYYLISSDIDLTMEEDFSGFGTEELPFTGVFVGEDVTEISEETSEEITRQAQILMAPTSSDGALRYGFIKYAKGAVVRNLHFNVGESLVKIDYTGVGSAVMAYVIGGDNLIDYVKVTGTITALSANQDTYAGSYSIAGAYVGNLQKGSVILRGYTADCLSDFGIYRQGDALEGAGAYQNGMIGKIQDGFVVDDTTTDISAIYKTNPAKLETKAASQAALNATDIMNVEDLAIEENTSFDIVADANGSADLQGVITDSIAVLDKTDKITVSQNTENGYQYGLGTSQDLLALSFAINSGAMNYAGNTYLGNTSAELLADIYGYDKFSRSRIDDYSYVGKADTNDASRAAYLNVIKYDNCNVYTNDADTEYICAGNTYGTSFYRPYIFNYFDFSGDIEVLSGNEYASVSTMNQYITDSTNQAKYISTYNLAAGEYNMAAENIKKCFKGIGARETYDSGKNTMICSLQGHFKGAGSDVLHEGGAVTNITLDLDISKYQDAALFNNLYKGTENDYYPYTISGFNLKGNVTNTYNKNYVSAAGIAPRVYGSYHFSDVFISDMTIRSLNDHITNTSETYPYNVAAGFIARADNHTSSQQNNTITFTDCKVGNHSYITALDECGGFIAVNETNGKGNTFTNCTVADTTMIGLRDNLGGFVGYTVYAVKFENCKLVSSAVMWRNTLTDSWNTDLMGIGGYIGHFRAVNSENKAEFDNCSIEKEDGTTMKVLVQNYNTTKRGKHCGGYIGSAQGQAEFNNCDILGLTMEQHTPSDIGGFVAYTDQIITVNTDENASSEVTDLNINRSFLGATGGIIGYSHLWWWDPATQSTKIYNINITGLQIMQGWEGECNLGGVIGNHSSGDMNIKNVHVIGTKEHPTKIKYRVAATSENLILSAGGIVGKAVNGSNNDTKLTLEDCSFSGEANEDGEYYAKIINSRYTGGLIGLYTNKNAVSIKNSTIENAAFTSTLTVSVYVSGWTAPHGGGGAVIGYANNGSNTEAGAITVENTTVSNVILRNYDEALSEIAQDWTGDAFTARQTALGHTKDKEIALGGIVGTSRKTLNVIDFNIDNVGIGEDGYAIEGGCVVGRMVSAPVTITKSENGSNHITNSRIVAQSAGGVIGRTKRENQNSAVGAPATVSDVSLENVTVLAKNLVSTNANVYGGSITGRHCLDYGSYDLNVDLVPPKNNSDANNKKDVHTYNNISVKNSVVTAYYNVGSNNLTHVGGMLGGLFASELRSYNISQENVLIGQLGINKQDVKDVTPTYDSVVDGTYPLRTVYYKGSGGGSGYGNEQLVAGTHDKTFDVSYGLSRGTWIGWYANATDSYILKAQVSHSEGLAHYHPVVDVGISPNIIQSFRGEGNTIYNAYELYNDNIHILYNENLTDTVANGTLIADSLGLNDYYFAQFDSVYNTKFTNQTLDSTCDYRLDYNYKQDNTDGTENYSVKDVFEYSYKTESGYLSPYEYNGEKIPMLVSAGKYDINTVINTAINIMTNNGGATNGAYSTASNTTAGKLLDVTIDRMKYQPNQADALFVKEDDGKEVITYNTTNGEFAISNTEYDSLEDGTFNLITVEYQHTDNMVYTLQIPVFVRETVKIETHMKGIAGSGYQIGDIQKVATVTEPAVGYSQVNVELNSTYTLYSEFIYSSARDDYAEIELEKSIYRTYENSTTIHPFDAGTMITLLDLTNNNMVYFYEVTEENQNVNGGKIMFEDFKAMDNTAYTTKDLSKIATYPAVSEYLDICNQEGTSHKEIGLEQFLIIVDESKINATTSTVYNLYIRAEEEDNVDLFRNATYTAPCYVKVNEIPELHKMLSGSNLYNSTDSTNLESLSGRTNTVLSENSKISRDGQLGLSGSAYILSPSTIDKSLPDYWKFAATSNRSQYLEFAISLEDNEGKRITVPDGTMVTIQIDGQTLGAIVTSNSEYIYCYYDTQSNKPEGSYLDLNTCTEDLAVNFDVTFDFSTATNFTEIEDKNYHVTVELLDTPDASYPRNGDVCDTITIGPVEGINKRNLGFALEPEDILTLGMNAYNSESSDRGRIAFKSRLDFSDYMDAGEDGLGLLAKNYEGKYITYTFVLERKNLDKNYESFGYNPNSRYDSLVKVVSGQALDDVEEVPTSADTDTEKQVIVTKTVKYNLDVNKAATGEAVQGEISRANPIMEEEFTLFADVKGLMETPANITNYKVTCYVTVSDVIPAETETIDVTALQNDSKANDFFIFTVAKLKTDMD